jgi:hypothetical protein
MRNVKTASTVIGEMNFSTVRNELNTSNIGNNIPNIRIGIKNISPPNVGVPDLQKCIFGPSSRTSCPTFIRLRTGSKTSPKRIVHTKTNRNDGSDMSDIILPRDRSVTAKNIIPFIYYSP